MEQDNDYGKEMIEQLKEKFTTTTSRSERLTILTALPKSWSIAKVMEEFGVKNYNSDVQQHDQDQEVLRDANLSHNGNCYLISSVTLLFMTRLHRRPESSGIKWNQVEQLRSLQDRTKIDYFFHFYSMQTVQQTLNCIGREWLVIDIIQS